MKTSENKTKGKLKIKRFLIAKLQDPQTIVGGTGTLPDDDPEVIFPTQYKE